jgi:hypothetical protein
MFGLLDRALRAVFWRPGVLCRLVVDQRGVVAVIMAFTLPVLIGFVGLGFDVGFWYFSKQNMQGAADAAAASAAAALSAGNNAGYITEAKAVAAQRGLVDGQNNVSVGVTFPYADATTACPIGNDYCLQVVIQNTNEPAMLSRVLGQGNFTIGARSVAQVAHETYCLLALNQGNVTGIDLTLLAGRVQFNNCSIGVNSTGSSAFTVTGFGSSELDAYTATVAGAFNNQCPTCIFNWTHPIKTNVGAPFTPIADPYSTVAVPAGHPPSSALSITSHTPCSPETPVGPFQAGRTYTLPAQTCYAQITINNTANVTVLGGGASGINGISVSAGGTLTLNTANYTIVGSSAGISVSGGSVTLNAGGGTTYIEGASGTPAIQVSGGALTTTSSAGGTIDILSGSSAPAVNMTGGAMTMTGNLTSTNNILGASGQPAITVGGGTFTLGDGNSNIQAGSSFASAIMLAGSGNVTTVDNTNGIGVVIGPPSPSTYAINVNTQNSGLTLGAGTYTIMGGIEASAGNLTLNPTGTSVGTYVINGGGGICVGPPGSGPPGSNVGLCITSGDLNGQNSTIVLTGTGSNYATAYTQGADGLNLTAPHTGPTAGLAIFQDRSAPPTGSNTAYGLSFLTVTGALYFPAQSLYFVGVTADLNNVCLQLIADTISITGLAWVNDICPAGVSPIAGVTTGLAQLVE